MIRVISVTARELRKGAPVTAYQGKGRRVGTPGNYRYIYSTARKYTAAKDKARDQFESEARSRGLATGGHGADYTDLISRPSAWMTKDQLREFGERAHDHGLFSAKELALWNSDPDSATTQMNDWQFEVLSEFFDDFFRKETTAEREQIAVEQAFSTEAEERDKRRRAEHAQTSLFGDTISPTPPVYFASGSNSPEQIRGIANIGAAEIGVAAPEVSKSAEAALVALAGQKNPNTGGLVQVFVDSGAFSEVTFSKKGPRVTRPITESEWDKRLSLYKRLADALGSQVTVVAPDQVGFQGETLARMRRYADRIQAIAKAGAHVMVPLQGGTVPLVQFEESAKEALGLDSIIPALPMKKGATSMAEVAAYVTRAQPSRLHLLGMGEKNKDVFRVERLIRRLSPNTVLSLDSSLIRASVGRGGARKKKTTKETPQMALFKARTSTYQGKGRRVGTPGNYRYIYDEARRRKNPNQIEFDFSQPEPKPLPTHKLEGYRREMAEALGEKARVEWVVQTLKETKGGLSYSEAVGPHASPKLRAAYDAWITKLAQATLDLNRAQHNPVEGKDRTDKIISAEEQVTRLTGTLRDLDHLDGRVGDNAEPVFARKESEGERDPLLQAVADAGGWQDIRDTFANLDDIVDEAVFFDIEDLMNFSKEWPRGVLKPDYAELTQNDPKIRGFEAHVYGTDWRRGKIEAGVRRALIEFVKEKRKKHAPTMRDFTDEIIADFKREIRNALKQHVKVSVRDAVAARITATDRLSNFTYSLRDGRMGHWGTAELRNEVARGTAVFGDGGLFRPLDKKMELVKLADTDIPGDVSMSKRSLGAELQSHESRLLAMSRYVYAQDQLRHFDRIDHPEIYRGMGMNEKRVQTLAPGDSIPLTGCTAFSFYRETAEHYSSSEWTTQLSEVGDVPVILELERTEEFDASVAGWHHKDKAPDQPAFEIVSGANAFEVTEKIEGTSFATKYPVAHRLTEAFEYEGADVVLDNFPEGYLIPVPFQATDGSRDILPGAFEKMGDGGWRVLGKGVVPGWTEWFADVRARGGRPDASWSKNDGDPITPNQVAAFLLAAKKIVPVTPTIIRGRGVLA